MDEPNDKEWCWKMLEAAKAALDTLPADSTIRRMFRVELFQEAEVWIGETSAEDPALSCWSPPIVFLAVATPEGLTDLDHDLALVLQHAAKVKEREITQFLRAARGDADTWYGRLFDVWARAALLRSGCSVAFDVPLSNGRDTDMRVEINERPIWIENTVITEDAESREVWTRYRASQKESPRKPLMRPGKYDPPNAKGPSPYYNARRIYPKVYDKIAKDLNPQKSQFPKDKPSILLLGGFGVHLDKPGYSWALDYLFCPWMGSDQGVKEIPDVSLRAWMEFHAGELFGKGLLTEDDYLKNWAETLYAPRRLGGIMLFDNFKLIAARLNYNTFPENRVLHSEMAELERLFSSRPSYAM